jgi:hypothetical protein
MGIPRRRVVSASTGLVTAAALVTALGGPAQARSDDYPCGPEFGKEIGGTIYAVQICPGWAGGDDWYECATRGDSYAHEGLVNDEWAQSMADNGKWGYVSQVYFQGGDNWESDASPRGC